MFIYRSNNEILSEILKSNIYITQIPMAAIPGSVSRSLLEVLVNAVSLSYDYINSRVSQIYPDTATGANLDVIGSSLNMLRRPGEDDDVYRYRLQNINRSHSMSNKTAITNALLGLPNVRDVYIVDNMFGIGSFGVYIEQNLYTTDIENTDLINDATDLLNDITAAGTKFIVLSPNYRTVDVDVSVMLKDAKNVNTTSIVSNIISAAESYINSMRMGDNIIYNKMLSLIVNAAYDASVDVNITNIYVDGARHLSTNVVALFDDRFIPGVIRVSFA